VTTLHKTVQDGKGKARERLHETVWIITQIDKSTQYCEYILKILNACIYKYTYIYKFKATVMFKRFINFHYSE